MRALVTGGAGFIGHHLVRRLLERGDHVTVIDDLSTGFRWRIEPYADRISVVEGSILDVEALDRAVAGSEVIFHEAAIPSVARSVVAPLATNAANVTGTIDVMLAAARHHVRRVVLAGSSSVYGPNAELPCRETQRPAPASPYAASKLAAEHYLHALGHLHEVETVALRYFNVFGPGQDPASEYSAVIPRFATAVLEGRRPTINGSGEISRDFTYVDNVVEANLLAAPADRPSGVTCNIACGTRYTLLELLAAIGDSVGRHVEPRYGPPREGDVPHSQADIAVARESFDYHPVVSFSRASPGRSRGTAIRGLGRPSRSTVQRAPALDRSPGDRPGAPVRRLRVAYVPASLNPGGAERQMLALAERLPRDHFDVEFLVLSGSGVYDERARAAGLRIRTIGDDGIPSGPLTRRLGHRASKALRYAAAVRAGGYDVVDAWLYPADVLAALMRPVTRTPVVITGRRNVDPQQFFGPLERAVASVVQRLTDVVVANSAAAAENAIATGAVSPEKIRIIRNGVVVPPPVTAGERQARRRAVGVEDPAEVVIGCVANFSPVKRHDLLIEAFAAIQDERCTTRLVLIGEGPLRPALEDQIRRLGLGDRVRLHGSEPRPEPLYAAFDIAVQASHREGLPNALLEAGAAGLPIVATAAGGSGEIVVDGHTGVLVPLEDGAALAGGLRRLVADPDLRARLGHAAREHVEATFGMDRFVAEFASLYEEQAAGRRVRR